VRTRRVVITGLGPVTPIGIGVDEFYQSLKEGRSAVSKITSVPDIEAWPGQYGAEINDFDLEALLSDTVMVSISDMHDLRKRDRSIHFGVVASYLALRDAGLHYDADINDIGLFIGNAMQCALALENEIVRLFSQRFAEEYRSFIEHLELLRANGLQENEIQQIIDEWRKKYDAANKPGAALRDFLNGNPYRKIGPIWLTFFNYAIPGIIARMLKLHGPVAALNSACSSGADAIGLAYQMIKLGKVPVIVAGGTEAPLCQTNVALFNNLRVMSKNGCKPFDKDRDGLALAEGSGMIVLEELNHARKRGARIYAEMVGYSATNDAFHLVAMHPQGKYLEIAIRDALAEAQIRPQEVDYVNAHGTSTSDCDQIESRVLKALVGDTNHLKVSSTKAATGHMVGGVGGAEAIACALAIAKQFVPPTVNLTHPDIEAGCDLDYVPGKSQEWPVRIAISNTMGFGGFNTTLVFRKYE